MISSPKPWNSTESFGTKAIVCIGLFGTCLRTYADMQIIVYVCIVYNISIDKDFGKYLHIHAYIPPCVISLFVAS